MIGSITEPATLATDWLMAALAVGWAVSLRRAKSPVLADWRRTFFLLALASFLGGAYHGFLALLPDPVLSALWRGTMLSSALMALFLLRAGLGQFGPGRSGPWWAFAHVKSAAAVLGGLAWPDFLLVLLDSGLSLALVCGFVLAGGRPLERDARRFLAGVGLFAVGALVQALGLAPHPKFNHNDLFHVIQIAGNWMFFRAARCSADGGDPA